MATNDQKLIRLQRLRKYLSDIKDLDASERAAFLKRKTGKSVSYWSGMLAGDRTFGEKAARSLETDLGLPRGHLDEPATLSARARRIAELFDAADKETQDAIYASVGSLVRLARRGEAASEPLPAPTSEPHRIQ